MASKSARVSVVVSSYNGGRFIDAAVRSALDQTFRDLEVIIVDDGSTDDTLTRLSCYEDDRLRIVRQRHRGPAFTVNHGIALAGGEYVAFLDGDDLWHRDKVARHVEFMDEHPSVALTFSWSRVISESGHRTRLHSRRWHGSISAQQLFTDFVISNNSAVIVRRDALARVGDYDEHLPLFGDMDLYIRIAQLGPGKAHAIPEELTSYRRRAGQVSRWHQTMEEDWERLIAKLRAQAPDTAIPVEPLARSNMSRFFAFLAYERRNFQSAHRLLWKAFRYAPLAFLGDLRNWKLASACASGAVLPAAWHRSLERLAKVGSLE